MHSALTRHWSCSRKRKAWEGTASRRFRAAGSADEQHAAGLGQWRRPGGPVRLAMRAKPRQQQQLAKSRLCPAVTGLAGPCATAQTGAIRTVAGPYQDRGRTPSGPVGSRWLPESAAAALATPRVLCGAATPERAGPSTNHQQPLSRLRGPNLPDTTPHRALVRHPPPDGRRSACTGQRDARGRCYTMDGRALYKFAVPSADSTLLVPSAVPHARRLACRARPHARSRVVTRPPPTLAGNRPTFALLSTPARARNAVHSYAPLPPLLAGVHMSSLGRRRAELPGRPHGRRGHPIRYHHSRRLRPNGHLLGP
jgi:hypothetical protein